MKPLTIDASAGLRRRVERHSPQRLLRKKVLLPAGIILSAEKHNGRLVVRVDLPDQIESQR